MSDRMNKATICLVATNLLTLFALFYVYVNQPTADPPRERLEQMVEAQDWLIGKMTEHRIQLVIENTRLKFGQHPPAPESELDDRLKAYKASRAEWRDLDASRDKLEVEYQAESPEQAESDVSDGSEETDFVR